MTSNDTGRITFENLNLIEPLLRALQVEGYKHPTPIQEQSIPHVLAKRDLLACAQTGTGKTAAFALPILQLLSQKSAPSSRPAIKVLVLAPTRELAAQIGESFNRYGASLKLTTAVIFGGVGQGSQVSALRRGVDILVSTPGRLLDLIEQRLLDISKIEIFVLDEADRMLDMGFIHDVRRVIKIIPQKRHTLFFSATMPRDIQMLAKDILSNPVKVEVTPIATTAEKISQSIYFVQKPDKRRLLDKLLRDFNIQRVLVFTRTKHGADNVTKFLNQGGISAAAIHGNKSQNNRIRALNSFKDGETRVLVATDIAARGIDIDAVTHVINFDLPNIPESYVHRIGRTARAGAEGIAISFCDPEERPFLADIEKLIRMKIEVVGHGLATAPAAMATAQTAPRGPRAQTPPPRQQQHARGQQRGGRPQQRSSRRPSFRDAPPSARASENRAPRPIEKEKPQPKVQAKSKEPWWKKIISSKS